MTHLGGEHSLRSAIHNKIHMNGAIEGNATLSIPVRGKET